MAWQTLILKINPSPPVFDAGIGVAFPGAELIENQHIEMVRVKQTVFLEGTTCPGPAMQVNNGFTLRVSVALIVK